MPDRFQERSAGILLHISSLPSDFGIGSVGEEAHTWVDYLAGQGFRYWQILPCNYPGYGDSPYNPVSSFAGSPWLIDPKGLYQMGLLTAADLQQASIPPSDKIDYQTVYQKKTQLHKAALQAYLRQEYIDELRAYMETEAGWLKPFMAFCLLKDTCKAKKWQVWSDNNYSDALFERLLQQHQEHMLLYAFQQMLFDRQMSELKDYAGSRGIRIIGDLPLYVSLFSSDVWSRPELFELDGQGHPIRVAGVPPDAFSSTGQLWGNPLYRWDVMQQDGYDWWIKRLERSFRFCHSLRLDHFIGYTNYWAVPAGEKDASQGNWIPGPQASFFDAVVQRFETTSFIAEDLGILTDEVNALRDAYALPGMIILQFCFADAHNDILAFPVNKVIYTGTHDNHTTRGWFKANKAQAKPDNALLGQYLVNIPYINDLAVLTARNAAEWMVRLALASPCHLCIIPYQDILNLDDRARINIPGTPTGNWEWQLQACDQLKRSIGGKAEEGVSLPALLAEYHRIG